MVEMRVGPAVSGEIGGEGVGRGMPREVEVLVIKCGTCRVS